MGNACKTKSFICMLYCSFYWVTCELTIKKIIESFIPYQQGMKTLKFSKHLKVTQKYPEVK